MAIWKGSEWRNWLSFYVIPCLQGIVPERSLRVLVLLSKAVFLLCRDIISEADLLEAERCLEEYVHQFQKLYGPENMMFNIYILTHMVQCVRSWGGLYAHGTMPFESWNHRISKTVTSPEGAIDQTAMRYLMHSLVNKIPQDNDISDEVKEIIAKKIQKSKFNDVRVVSGAYFFGKETVRNVTQREMQILTKLGFESVRLTEYYQVKINNLECRSVQYIGESQSNRDDCVASKHVTSNASPFSLNVFLLKEQLQVSAQCRVSSLTSKAIQTAEVTTSAVELPWPSAIQPSNGNRRQGNSLIYMGNLGAKPDET
ncbi:hypothetical protein ONE63_001081 [Megalurothrips usitatus]|uniref:Uncharacterized protein n=1 Tax=Megalurothrips usitatus TaxID=439358 RepID=A0AAV7XE35_9NEOP|nr:hypothetical protein ONE63_001081 [Megalurothrips usitatus]